MTLFEKPEPWGYRADTTVVYTPIPPHFKKSIRTCPHAATEYPVYKRQGGPAYHMCVHCGMFNPPETCDY
jgi:hypothetical protein